MYTAEARRVESRPATDSNRQVNNFKPTRAGRVKLFNRQRTIGAFSLLGTVTDFSLLTLHSGVAEVKHRV